MEQKIAVRIAIPEGVAFTDLRLQRNLQTGAVTFRWDVLEQVARASGLDIRLFEDEDNVSGLLVAWYFRAREAGEPPDPVQEELIRETLLEDQHGHGFSHTPGRA